jgi:hypothetical protein
MQFLDVFLHQLRNIFSVQLSFFSQGGRKCVFLVYQSLSFILPCFIYFICYSLPKMTVPVWSPLLKIPHEKLFRDSRILLSCVPQESWVPKMRDNWHRVGVHVSSWIPGKGLDIMCTLPHESLKLVLKCE